MKEEFPFCQLQNHLATLKTISYHLTFFQKQLTTTSPSPYTASDALKAEVCFTMKCVTSSIT